MMKIKDKFQFNSGTIVLLATLVVGAVLLITQFSNAFAESTLEDTEKKTSSEELTEEAESKTAEPATQENSSVAKHNVSVEISKDGLEPSDITVEPGTTVVWVNKADAEVRVHFTSKAVSTTCKAPLGFELDTKGVYASETIFSGGVASLCFLEPDQYRYMVDFIVDGEKLPTDGEAVAVLDELQGVIQVRE